MAESAWTILGIAPTHDAAAIRRAYAARLKALRPETDPEGFQRLLAARGWALREAQRLQEPLSAGAADDSADGSDPSPQGPPPPREPGARIVVTDEAPAAHQHPEARVLIRDVDLAPLEADRTHWQDAQRLAAAFEDLLRDASRPVSLSACRALLAETERLPRAPRDEVEAKLVQLLARGLRTTGRSLDRRRVKWIRPVLAEAEPVFDWMGEDAVITSALPAADAAVFCALARDASLAVHPRRRATVPARRGVWPGLADADARACLRGYPPHLAAYEAFRASGRLRWRLDGLAFVLPAVWGARHRSLSLFLLAFAATWGAFVLAEIAHERRSGVFALGSAAVYLAVHLGYGLGADRLVLWAARRTARRASRKLIYYRRAREEYLVHKSMLPNVPQLSILYFAGMVLCFAPYTGLVMLLDVAQRQ
jgi:hypothetical protein